MQSRQYTGLARNDRKIEWTVLRQTKEFVEISEHEEVELSGLDGDDGPKAAPGRPDVRGTLCTAIPVGEALLRVVRLPSTDRYEIEGMVELQIGKISPFPVEDIVVSFELLSSRDGLATVLIVAARRELLEKLRVAGSEPRHIDIDVMGWWHAISARPGLDGRIFNLILHAERAELIASDDGVPILVRVLAERDELELDKYIAMVSEELHYSTIAIEADWGEGLNERIELYIDGEFQHQSDEEFSAIWGMPVECRPLGDLPPLSELLARRRMERAEACLNLAPPEWLKAGAERLLKRRVLRSVAVLATVWVAFIGGILAYGGWERASMQRLERRAEELKGPAMKSLELQSRIAALERYADRSRSVLECLREVSVLLPPRIELQSFSFKKGGELSLRGLSSSISAADIYTYFQALEKSDKFQALEDQQVSTVTRRSGGRTSEFQTKLLLPAEEVE